MVRIDGRPPHRRSCYRPARHPRSRRVPAKACPPARWRRSPASFCGTVPPEKSPVVSPRTWPLVEVTIKGELHSDHVVGQLLHDHRFRSHLCRGLAGASFETRLEVSGGTAEGCCHDVGGKGESEVARRSVPELECEAAIPRLSPDPTGTSTSWRVARSTNSASKDLATGPAAHDCDWRSVGSVSVARRRLAPVSARPSGLPRRDAPSARLCYTTTEVTFSVADHR